MEPNLLLSPAKLNLGLRILGRRPDGYHLLESLFWPVSFHDEIRLLPDGKKELRAEWAETAPKKTGRIPVGEENILKKAALAFPEFSDSIHLKKRIPMGAGLGGGSSNAGTFLGYLREKFVVTPERLESIAIILGADVPYFLDPKPAWVTGIGERRVSLEMDSSLKELAFLLVFPPFECSTQQIFSLYGRKKSEFSASLQQESLTKVTVNNLLMLSQGGRNDLTSPAVQAYPQLKEILQHLAQAKPLFSGMSGSGSTCYAAFESQESLEESSKGLHHFFRSTHCATTTVTTHGVISS